MENVFVIFGENEYKIKLEINKIITKQQAIDISKYDMNECTFNDIIIDLSTQSLLGDKKAVICENAFFLTGAKSDNDQKYDEISKYILNPNKDSVLILTVITAKLDSRKKIVDAFKKNGTIIECLATNEKDYINIIKTILNDNGCKMDDKTINYLVSRVGNNPDTLTNEMNKLVMYKLEEKIIEKSDIDDLVPKHTDDDIFSLIDNLVNNNKSKAFEIYSNLILNGEEPIKIIVMLANQFRLIYQVKAFTEKNMKESEIASELKIHPYRVKLAKEKSTKFTKQKLKDNLDKLADLDYKIKTGKINKNYGLEMFFIQM